MTTLLWTLIAIQIAMAAFDTIFHHELTERLAWRPSQQYELVLHAARSFVYAALFLVLGFLVVKGLAAWAVIVALAVEVVITLADFVEEDMSRKLPATERVNHTLLAINYGAILILIFPPLAASAMEPTAVALTSHGCWSALMVFACAGAVVFGLRDLVASRRATAAHHAARRTRRRAAAAPERARDRRDRLHRPPPRAGADHGRARRHRAGARP